MTDQSAPKYDDLNNRFPGDFRAGEIVLYSYGGSELEISGMTAVVNIYLRFRTQHFIRQSYVL